jgi:hypothetical protein
MSPWQHFGKSMARHYSCLPKAYKPHHELGATGSLSRSRRVPYVMAVFCVPITN